MAFYVLGLVVLLAIGAPIFAVIIGFTIVGAESLVRPESSLLAEFAGTLASLVKVGTGEEATVLSTVPLFIFTGYVMAASRTADRLVAFANALLGWFPGGLAIVTIFACAIFTVFSGASGVTIVALGGLVMPSLIREKYPHQFSLGLVAGTGSVGLLFPPALPLFVYGTVYGLAAQTASDTGAGELKTIAFSTDKFLWAGVGAGGLLCGLLCVYAVAVALARKVPRQKFSMNELGRTFTAAIPELGLPVVILLPLIMGVFTIPESAAAAAVYVLIIEAGLWRDIKLRQLWNITRESMALVGAIFIIILAASALTNYFVTAQIPNKLVTWMGEHIDSKWQFLLALNLLLLFVGMVMDIFSAIVVVVPLITPAAMRYGIDPYHLGVIFLLNLELGYITPPVGLNLFITSFKFDRPITEVMRATLPFLLVMIFALGLVTFVPALTPVKAPRQGRIGEFAKQVEIGYKRLSQVSEVPMGDGTVLTPEQCDEMETLNRTACNTLFAAYSGCRTRPEAERPACQQAAIEVYCDDVGCDDDDLELDDFDDDLGDDDLDEPGDDLDEPGDDLDEPGDDLDEPGDGDDSG